MGRPRKSEKYSAEAQEQLIRELCGEALLAMREMIKQNKVTFQDLSNFVGKALPTVLNKDTGESNKMLTMDMLMQKSIRVSMRIREANEEGLKEEEEEGDKPNP